MSVGLSELISSGNFVCLREFPGYGVSSDGKVWSCFVNLGQGKYVLGDRWKPRKGSRVGPRQRHLMLPLRKNGKPHYKLVHRLVLEAFTTECPDGLQCCHNDGDPTNNRLENLRWDTPMANIKDQVKHGVKSAPPVFRGSNHPCAKLSDLEAQEIREKYANGVGPKNLMNEYNCGEATIYRIIHRQGRWSL